MGLQLTVSYREPTPDWEAVRERLSAKGISVTLRMIDGMPAFPNEVPDPGWNELRLSTENGMLTLRKAPDGITCIVWGNADEKLQREQVSVAETLVELTKGTLSAPRSAH
jgi:hypothetical protein